MELLSKRPFALGCILFFFTSFLAGYLPVFFSLLGMVVAILLALLVFLIPVVRRHCFGMGLCLCIVAAALCDSYITTELPRQRAETAVGEHTVLCRVLEEDRTSEYGTSVTVKILQMDGKRLQVKGSLYLDASVDLSVGDQLILPATVELHESGNDRMIVSRKDNGGVLLRVYSEDISSVTVHKLSEDGKAAWSTSLVEGCLVTANRFKTLIRELLDQMLGEDIGALALGFFLGDTQEIAPSVLRDFRRTGVFHILSVSGLHLTVLLGSVDWMLQKLRIPRRGRIPVLSLLGLCLLALTGFASSACRSVLMLLIVYLQFMVLEEYDGITSLFFSAVLIVLFSPYAVNDLGFWMSFQATLGLLTVFPLWERKHHSTKKRSLIGRLGNIFGSILSGLLLTLVANLFLLPIFWISFGEISWISFVCNILIAPLSSVFLVSIPILLLVCRIPLVGQGIAFLVHALGKVIIGIAEWFSRLPGGSISLKYDFCPWIILPLTVMMIVLLLIRLRRKWILALPPVMAVMAFCLCLIGYHLWFAAPEAAYVTTTQGGEVLCVREERRLLICDLSEGGYRGALGVREALSDSLATEVECLIFTDLTKEHLSMLEELCGEMIIRRICMPKADSAEEKQLWEQMHRVAQRQHIGVTQYEPSNGFAFSEECTIWIERPTKLSTALAVRSEAKELLYLSGTLSDSLWVERRMEEADAVIFGKRCSGLRGLSLTDNTETEAVIFGSAQLGQNIYMKDFAGTVLVPRKEKKQLSFSLPLTEECQ